MPFLLYVNFKNQSFLFLFFSKLSDILPWFSFFSYATLFRVQKEFLADCRCRKNFFVIACLLSPFFYVSFFNLFFVTLPLERVSRHREEEQGLKVKQRKNILYIPSIYIWGGYKKNYMEVFGWYLMCIVDGNWC